MMKYGTRCRRRNYRKIWMVGILVFVAIFLFTFLIHWVGVEESGVNAVSLAEFDPGYIMSDYQMSNYGSMTEVEIQAWLTSKNSCPNTDYDLYLRLSANYPAIKWNFKDGHFVCISEELFGDGETIGTGETAAHIIWQAAQDYHINPQVILVLLQKENSLITDPIPNSFDYRTATGYGCPDTAACSSTYYGFKNQVRWAAKLFSDVLNGGWTNFPLGDNFIRYGPNCNNGSVVNIRSLATSALYRYTPYQPSSGVLAAGYGLASDSTCSAYGNRNFYLYFEDWFGGITDEFAKYVSLDVPRYMKLNETAERITSMGEVFDIIEQGRVLKFTSKTIFKDGSACLRTEYATRTNVDACIPMKYLKEIELEYELINNNQKKIIKPGAEKIYIRGENKIASYSDKLIRNVVAKTTFNGNTYYITEYDFNHSNSEYGFLEEYIEDIPEYQLFDETIIMTPINEAKRFDPVSGEYFDTLKSNIVYKFASYLVLDDIVYYRTEHNTKNEIELAIAESNLLEVEFEDLEIPRYFILNEDAERINVATGEKFDILKKNSVIKFASKIKVNNKWYYRTEHNTLNNYALVVDAQYLSEVN